MSLVVAKSTRSRISARIANALSIMSEGPIGAASFNNEFGVELLGYFAVTTDAEAPAYGYHKPT